MMEMLTGLEEERGEKLEKTKNEKRKGKSRRKLYMSPMLGVEGGNWERS